MRKQSSELLQDQLQDRQPGLHGSAETAPVRQVRGAAAARERRRDAPRALGMRSLLRRENAPCGPSWRVWRALYGQGQQMNAGAVGIGRGFGGAWAGSEARLGQALVSGARAAARAVRGLVTACACSFCAFRAQYTAVTHAVAPAQQQMPPLGVGGFAFAFAALALRAHCGRIAGALRSQYHLLADGRITT